ncbi:hypothetical protein, partial [Vibrio cholerae]|uniref:hypothetical protein n=1 Tax=Vibrio cholerae TaxID=666 RepID=UPI001F3144EF
MTSTQTNDQLHRKEKKKKQRQSEVEQGNLPVHWQREVEAHGRARGSNIPNRRKPQAVSELKPGHLEQFI